jgi:hypothetical protein
MFLTLIQDPSHTRTAMTTTQTTLIHPGFRTSIAGSVRPDATARAIAQFDRLTDRATVAAVGVALHHFVEPLGSAPDLELHRATTILSKQARPLIDRPDGLAELRELVIDPRRVATPDGRTAAEYCGDAWEDVRAVALDRATSACEGAETFGPMALLNLAVIRGVNSRHPWWGTVAWDQQVDAWAASRPHRQHHSVRADPELTPDDVLLEVLNA